MPGSHVGTKLPSRGLSEIPRQGHGPTGAARALRELWLGQFLRPQQQIQSWRITKWNKIQQCNKIARCLARLQPSEHEQPGFVQEAVWPLRVTSCLGSPARGGRALNGLSGAFHR